MAGGHVPGMEIANPRDCSPPPWDPCAQTAPAAHDTLRRGRQERVQRVNTEETPAGIERCSCLHPFIHVFHSCSCQLFMPPQPHWLLTGLILNLDVHEEQGVGLKTQPGLDAMAVCHTVLRGNREGAGCSLINQHVAAKCQPAVQARFWAGMMNQDSR